jgi:antibiotic biosynthesis monooxygenase (ABM) superfamily enzyme
VVTWIGVCFTVFVVNTFFSLFNQNWPFFVNLLVANAVIVAGLTWTVMPALAWLFQRWLSPQAGKDPTTRYAPK